MNTPNLVSKTISVFFVLICLVVLIRCQKDLSSDDHSTWTHYAGGPDQSKYFVASPISKANVSHMKIAWIYPTDDDLSNYFSPIIVDSIMYVMGKNRSLIALNASSGKEIWIHTNLKGLTKRGINYWESEDKRDRRLIFTLNHTLQAIDAITGKSIISFGDSGYVDLRAGLDRPPTSIRRVQSMMPGVIFDSLIVIGSSPGENYFSPPGHVRAYNVVSGKLAWTFHTIPHPGEFGYETWPKDAYKYVGGVNVWSEISVDVGRGIAYLPVGSPTYDFYGADRTGSNLFGNSLVALDVRTGKRLWHFQTVHHDLWDYDLASAPQLLTVKRKGKLIDAVAVATKQGFVFVFDRVTGDPVFPVEENPFPASRMPGEESWPTQPIPALPSFTRHEVTKETLNPYFPDSVKQYWHQRLDSAKSGLYTPLSDQYETIALPGALGGANFGNTASDPNKGILYIMTQECSSIYHLNKVEHSKPDLSEDKVARLTSFYSTKCQTCHGEKMVGGVGPSLENVGHHLYYDEFQSIVTNGRGQMPGFVHVDEEMLKALFVYLGGNPARVNVDQEVEHKTPDGPVVASGGAQIKPDEKRYAPMSAYPTNVPQPENRYTTGYGIEWTGLLSPPWSSLVAYDLNKGTIKWRTPIGEDSLYVQGDKTAGAPNGTQRKGMVVTSTGVIFATAKGGKLYAIDVDQGDILWETTLSHEANAQPSMYTHRGKQYLVINATSNFMADSYDHSKKPNALPKGYVVYTLPD